MCSTYDMRDLPSDAGASGAAGYVNKERLGADLLRQIWAHRDVGWPGRTCLIRSAGWNPARWRHDPVADCQRTVPPMAPSRSAMFMYPWPLRAAATSKPGPSSVTANSKPPDSSQSRTVTVDAWRVLGRVLQGLQAAEVHRGLDIGRVPAPAQLAVTRDGEWATARGCLERLGEAAIGEQRRVDPVRQIAELGDSDLEVVSELVQQLRGGLRLVGQHVTGQPQADRQCHQVLLGTVVQVALQPSSLGVAARHDPGPRLAQRLGLRPQLVERVLQGRVELGVMKGEADLSGQIGEHTVVFLGEAVAGRRPLDDDQPEQLAGVADGGDPQLVCARARRAGRATRRSPTRCRTPRPWL